MPIKRKFNKREIEAFHEACKLNGLSVLSVGEDNNRPVRIIDEMGKEYLVSPSLTIKPIRKRESE